MDEQIRDHLSTKAVRVIELFRQWDDDDTGHVDRKEFRRGMRECGVLASREQLDSLFDCWDPDGSGEISIDELHAKVREKTQTSSGPMACARSSAANPRRGDVRRELQAQQASGEPHRFEDGLRPRSRGAVPARA